MPRKKKLTHQRESNQQNIKGTPTEQVVIEGLIKGGTYAGIAERVGCHPDTVRNIKWANADMIRKEQEQLRMFVIEHSRNRIPAIIDALADSASDPENKNQANASKSLACDWMGMNGKGPLVHIGDNVTNATQINIDATKIEHDPERIAELERELGLAD